MKNRYSTRGSVNRTVVILLILIGVMLFVIGIPAMKAFRYRAQRIGCEQAMKSAADGLIIEYLGSFEEGSVDDARDTLDEVMPAREDLCPAHGNVYLIRDANGIFQPVCGLHDSDVKRRTRLNASYALQMLEEERRTALPNGKSDPDGEDDSGRKNDPNEKDDPDGNDDLDGEDGSDGEDDSDGKTVPNGKNGSEGEDDPETLEITVNGRKLVCARVSEEEAIHRGTATTNGYKGIVCYYGIAGDFTFSAKTAGKGMGTAKEGEICYFLYADENYCAIWRSNDGWDGDAYQ